MASSLEQQLAKVNGIVIPSKLPEGQQLLIAQKTHPTDAKLDKSKTKMCPICGHTSTKTGNIRSHFVACVKMNGNPTGARWDDNVKLVPRRHLVKRKQEDLDESANTDNPSTSKRTARAPTTTEQRNERQRQFHKRLAAVNGVVIPSKLAPGKIPAPKTYDASENRKFQCPICGGLHKRTYHVQSHFASCVETYGNPTGARWNEAWNGTGCRTERESARDSSETQDYQMQDHQPEDHELADLRFDDSVMDNIPPNGYQHNEPQSASSSSDDFELYDTHLEKLDPHLVSSSSNSLQPYDPSVGMNTLTNEVLLSMVKEWQEVIYYGEETYAMQHPQFQQALKELEYRGMLDANWTWIVDVEKVDMALTRTTM